MPKPTQKNRPLPDRAVKPRPAGAVNRSSVREDDLPRLQRNIERLDAETEEELDALRVNLFQDDDRPTARDGSGLVVDEVAEEEIAGFTEVGPLSDDRGAISVTVGSDDTSGTLRRHYSNDALAGSEEETEDSLDETSEDDVD